MEAIRILQLGTKSWETVFELPDHISFTFWQRGTNPPEREDHKNYDLVFLCCDLSREECRFVEEMTDPYRVYVLQSVVPGRDLAQLCAAMMAQRVWEEEVPAFLSHEAKYFFAKPYGEKFQNHQIAVSPHYQGNVVWDGLHNLILCGAFGEGFSQLLYWKRTIPISEGQGIDLWLEYETSGEIEIRLKTVRFSAGNLYGRGCDTRVFSEEEMQRIVQVEAPEGPCTLFVSVEARGTGMLRVRALHDRHSRGSHGFFLPGGRRHITSDRQEIFSYFHPGNLRPPLNVYFAGFKTMQSFEGFYLMKLLKHPFLLITESRQVGGGAYYGSEEFEALIPSIVREHLELLGFSNQELILSGLSMGTTAALYYGSILSPHAILLGKPLTNWGLIAENERIRRPGGFPPSLEVLRQMEKGVDREDSMHLDAHFWEKVDRGDFSQTRIAISYMLEDDYDPRGYEDIVRHIRSKGMMITARGFHGRHNDDSASINRWFLQQYQKILSEDFGEPEKSSASE